MKWHYNHDDNFIIYKIRLAFHMIKIVVAPKMEAQLSDKTECDIKRISKFLSCVEE